MSEPADGHTAPSREPRDVAAGRDGYFWNSRSSDTRAPSRVAIPENHIRL